MSSLSSRASGGDAPDGTSEETNDFGAKRILSGCPIYVAKPENVRVPAGLTFVLTAANIPLSKYVTIRDALLSQGHVVVGYMINALNPPLRNNRTKAQNVRNMYLELRSEMKADKLGLGIGSGFALDRYDIVGHSVGGKIALLVAALHNDDGSLRNVVALDPKDQSPVEFTNTGMGAKNLSLKDTKTSITLTFTDHSFVSKDHNGRAIQKYNPDCKLVNHRNAGHFCYCDDEGRISWKSVLNAVDSGNPDRNDMAKKEAVRIIKEKKSGGGGVTGGVTKGIKSVKKDVMGAIKDVTGDAEKAAKKGKAMFMMKGLMGM